MSDAFDYDGTLKRLIERRFEASLRGQQTTPEIRQLEERIYAHLRSRPKPDVPADPDEPEWTDPDLFDR